MKNLLKFTIIPRNPRQAHPWPQDERFATLGQCSSVPTIGQKYEGYGVPMGIQASSGPVDTGKVAGRRKLRFESIDEMMAEVDRLVQAEKAGRLKRLGNWTVGQMLGHLAVWAEYSYTGPPIKAPFFIKLIFRLRKRKFLYGSMPAGVKIPGIKGGTLATEPMPLDEALGRLQRAMERLKTEAPTVPNVIFGPLRHEEWIAMTLRHAELHLGFLIPE
jgi:hypothetical protein